MPILHAKGDQGSCGSYLFSDAPAGALPYGLVIQ
jgi:hypothetical protein